ncbi:MAG: hypothetical protein IJY12_04225 [Clostridia bacterium]|nr:hypothetical protein [Clostridia bacterium]
MKTKKLLSWILMVVLLFSFNFSSYATSLFDDSVQEDLERAANVLLQSGWTQEEIDDLLTEEVLLEYKDVQSVMVSDKKYFKVASSGDVSEVTEADCALAVEQRKLIAYERMIASRDAGENSVGVMAVIPGGETVYDEVLTTDGYLEYYVSAYNCGNGEYILSARYEWVIDPYNKKVDVFGLGHCDGLTQVGDSGGVYYVYKADVTQQDGIGTIEYVAEITTPTELCIDDGGTVVSQDLISNTSETSALNHRGFIQYRAALSSTTELNVSIFAEYLHQEAIIGVSPGLSFPEGGSIGITFENKYKRMSPNPYLQFEVQ